MASFFYMRTLPACHSSETPHRHQAVATQEPSRYLGGLCNHFRRKINVEYNDLQGLTHFPLGGLRT
ncbi:DUF2218 domain-containing protein [Methylophilus rhizosphaerae]|uniref:DUF2218 domain-containing protein n=1 Tax=Methylophilus rhizosphaerae TaxID=492660 RepID=UPI00115FBBBE